MITETLIRRMEDKTAACRRDAVRRLGHGVPLSYISTFLNGCDAIEEIYQKMMQDQLRINERKNKVKKGGKKK